MEKEERQLMLKIAKEVKFCVDWIANFESKPPAVASEPVQPLNPLIAKKASKFFGEESNSKNYIVLEDNNIPQQRKEQITQGRDLLKRAVTEFCEEFKIKEFDIFYKKKDE